MVAVTEHRVLLIRIIVGRGTVRHHPVNQDKLTNILSVETVGNNHGSMIEMIPAIRKYERYYKLVKMPDGVEIMGDIFYNAKNYAEFDDTPFIRRGVIRLIREIDSNVDNKLKMLQKNRKSVERFFESMGTLKE